MASFQAKTGRDKIRMRKKKILVPIHSNPTRNREFQQNCKKLQIIKKHHYDFISTKTGQDRLRVIQKKKLSFRSVPTRPGKGNSKTIAKKCKKLIIIIMSSFQAKMGRDRLRVIQKTKSHHFDPFQPNPK